MVTVANLLKIKGGEVWSVNPETTTRDALNLMAKKGVGALLVLENGKLAGIISERDFVRQIAKQGVCNLDSPVKNIMTESVYYVVPTMTSDDCMVLMTEKHIRHLPVLESEKVVGVISIGDVVKQVIADNESLIKNLEDYITGRGFSG